ncbi:MAG: hypothetical protein DMG05_19675 [Acidobacteria bacterium]|nr:MAG: hypothetical protein DMG05_19675 [Acidobacteriota bacterium]
MKTPFHWVFPRRAADQRELELEDQGTKGSGLTSVRSEVRLIRKIGDSSQSQTSPKSDSD